MAIHRYNSDITTNITSFYNWISSKKTGTFLENTTIETRNSGQDFIIKGTKISIKLSFRDSSSRYNFIEINEVTSLNLIYSLYSEPYSSARFAGAILCNNGLIITCNLYDVGSTPKNYHIVISKDSNDEICLLANSSFKYTDDNLYMSYSYNCTSNSEILLKPCFNSPLTSIATPVPITPDNTLFSSVYMAINTQQEDIGLNAILLNGNSYITNGLWYIKD